MVVSLTLNENSLIGGFLSGVILSSILFGILSVQAALYFQYFPNDKFWIRLMVAISWVIQGVQVFITAFVVYFRLIGDWAPDDVPDLIDLPWYSTIWQLVSVVAALGTQTCLVLRLHTLLGSRCLPVLTFATAVITFALGIWSVSVFIDGDISQIRTSYLSWLVSTTLVDTKLAFCMMFVIHRRKTGITSTDRALQTMMVYAITTGMLTAFVSLAIVIGNSVGNGEHSGIVALGIGFSQLHTMTLLSILHGRRKVKKHLYADNVIDIPMDVIRTLTPDQTKRSRVPTPIVIIARSDDAGHIYATKYHQDRELSSRMSSDITESTGSPHSTDALTRAFSHDRFQPTWPTEITRGVPEYLHPLPASP